MSQESGKLVLITGASEGLGYEFARVFAENKYNLILTARNTDKLERVKNEIENRFSVEVKIIPKDISNIGGAIWLCDYIENNCCGIDALVNNAGAGLYGRHLETDFEEELKIINLNAVSLTYITKRMLKNMIKKNSGYILNIASTAALKPGPMMSVYYATKAYVLNYSESLAAELHGTGISVTAFVPGPVRTGFFEKATAGKNIDNKLKKYMTARDAAIYGFNAMIKRKLISVPGLTNKILNFIIKFIPRKILGRILYISKAK